MPVRLNHFIVHARESQASARFLSGLLSLPAPVRFGPFFVVAPENSVSLDFIDTVVKKPRQLYSVLICEPEFDEIFARRRKRGLPFSAEPGRQSARAGSVPSATVRPSWTRGRPTMTNAAGLESPTPGRSGLWHLSGVRAMLTPLTVLAPDPRSRLAG